MNSKQATNLEYAIDQASDTLKSLEYNFVTATKYSDRKEILHDYRIAQEDLDILISEQDW